MTIAPDRPTTRLPAAEVIEVVEAIELIEPAEQMFAPPPEQLPVLIEALLFVADGPVEETTLARALGIARRQIDAPLVALAETLRGRGLRLQRGPEGVQLVTAPLASTYVEQFLGIEAGRRLSTAALETLAIVAYRQPVTRGGLEAIRGVNCDGALDTLRTRGLVDTAGRAETPGRPVLFATTQKFLEYFGLERPEDLPALPEAVAELAASLPERIAQLSLDASIDAAPRRTPAVMDTGSELSPVASDPLPREGGGLGWGPPTGHAEPPARETAAPASDARLMSHALPTGSPVRLAGPPAAPSFGGAAFQSAPPRF